MNSKPVNVLYHYGPDKLVIGKFCSIATNVRFVMNGRRAGW